MPWHTDHCSCQLTLTNDGRWFTTVGVHLCVQHSGCDVMHHVGLDVTAETEFSRC